MHDHCGKVPYPNPAMAWRAMRTLSSKLALISHKNLYKRGQVYHCPTCNAWHLTHRLPLKRPEGGGSPIRANLSPNSQILLSP